jgi:hypothetical protein
VANADLVVYQVALFGKGMIEDNVKKFRLTEETKTNPVHLQA